MLTSCGYMDKALHWVEIVGAFLAIVLALLELPPRLASAYRTVQNRWSLLSRQRTVNRLAKLEEDLAKLDDPLLMEERQRQFYHAMFAIMYLLAAGLFVETAHFYSLGPPSRPLHLPLPPLVLAMFFFVGAIAVAGWGMTRFLSLLAGQRRRLRHQIEQGIKTMREKLAKRDCVP